MAKVFEMFKKIEEEKNNKKQNITESREKLEENCNEEKQNPEPTIQEPFQSTEADFLSMLESLEGEERTLIAEKSQLLDMEETLKQRIIDEIEIKKRSIENLKYEIPDLKQRCEALAKVLEIPVQK